MYFKGNAVLALVEYALIATESIATWTLLSRENNVLAEVSRYGTSTIMRAYGDWTTQNLRS